MTGSVVRYPDAIGIASGFRLALIGFRPALGHELGPNGAQAEGLCFFADTPMTITDTSGATFYREPNVKNMSEPNIYLNS